MPSFFQSIALFFAPPRREGPRSGASRQTLSYTHDAFSLPTHSPTTSQLEQSSLAGPSHAFSYPPATPGTSGEEGFTPLASDRLDPSRATGNSILPMYQPRSASLAHPPLDKTWERIRTWLASEFPELGDTLNYGALPDALAEIELNLGVQLPRAVRESYLVVDGQEAESSAGCSEGLFFGLTFLSLEEVLEEWRYWREVDEDPATGANLQLRGAMQSIPPGWIRREYSCRGWIPLITDKAGNYIGVDLTPPPLVINQDGTPGQGGTTGQVIIFGRDFDTKIVLWRGDGESGWARWLASFVEELEAGEGFEVRGSDSDRDISDAESEDSVGYQGYFYAGAGGGKGGDAGSHGSMRFTGEYKGWTAIEVWADRSYKRWHAAGLIPDEPNAPEEPIASGSGQAPSIEITTQPLISTDLPPSSSANDEILDSAVSAELIPLPAELSSPTDQSTPTVTASFSSPTTSPTASQTPLIPPPASTTSNSKAKTPDLLSLNSPSPPLTNSAADSTGAQSTLPAPLEPSSLSSPTDTKIVDSPAAIHEDVTSQADDSPPAESTIRLVNSSS